MGIISAQHIPTFICDVLPLSYFCRRKVLLLMLKAIKKSSFVDALCAVWS